VLITRKVFPAADARGVLRDVKREKERIKKKKTVFGARTGEDGKKRERGMVAFAVVVGVVVVG
jgi:hypothetical protein